MGGWRYSKPEIALAAGVSAAVFELANQKTRGLPTSTLCAAAMVP